jgi:16S rRNA (cytosine967-C5)-methyltransferase
LDTAQPLKSQLQRALEFAKQFETNPIKFPDSELISRSVPPWLWEEAEVMVSWARSLQAKARLWLRAKRGKGREVAKKLGDCRNFGAGVFSDTLEYIGNKDLFRTAEFHSGEFELQDLNSQAVGFMCDPRPGETWWDACAGEGGKTLLLSGVMENKGLIWVSDRAEWRLRLLKRRAARAGVFNYRIAPWRNPSTAPTKTKFDGVLLDAPCSGVGTWQRNPHARWTMTLQDVVELAAVQERLLRLVAGNVKPGGRLVYSVCTLTRSETVAVADAFEKAFPDFEPLATADPFKPGAPAKARFTFWPQDFGGNGMFVAIWRRRESG